MEINSGSSITGTRNTWERGAVRENIQERGNIARPPEAGTPSKRHSYSIGPFTDLGRLLISYEINRDNGAISAKMINPESGRVVREIDVKPPVRPMQGKGSLFESKA